MWKDENEEVKATWKAKADEAKKQHLQRSPGYSYQPRKPSEKKRRMTKRKMAATSAPIAVENNVQKQVQSTQQPLPSFTASLEDPNMFTSNLSTLGDTSVAAIDSLGLMVDQHNAGLVPVDNARSKSVGINFDDSVASDEDLDQLFNSFYNDLPSSVPTDTVLSAPPYWESMDNDGNMMTAEEVDNQQYLNSAMAKELEQDRQEVLFAGSEDWECWQNSALIFQ